jgi:hypothetical protein
MFINYINNYVKLFLIYKNVIYNTSERTCCPSPCSLSSTVTMAFLLPPCWCGKNGVNVDSGGGNGRE